jgi:DNA ligase 1
VDTPYARTDAGSCRAAGVWPRRESAAGGTPLAEELQAYEERCLAAGYEGVMIRTPGSPYKCGRSTEREGYLLKIKRFEDAEAVVLDTYEGMSNQNAAELDAFGRTKRSLRRLGMVGRGELGGFVVGTRKPASNSAGLQPRRRRHRPCHPLAAPGHADWSAGEVQHQPSGAKEAPRFPKFIGFREAWDL